MQIVSLNRVWPLLKEMRVSNQDSSKCPDSSMSSVGQAPSTLSDDSRVKIKTDEDIGTGYEVEGLENIPDKGPAVVIFYHGALPMDWYYLIAKFYLTKKRLMVSVADRLLFKIPGWGLLMKISGVIPGTSEDCVRELKKGNIIFLSPGGLREAQFGDENYKLMWGERCGFARVAVEAKVPVIPVFTKNVRESFSTLLIFRKWQKDTYERNRYPTAPLYGGFPVKLKTFVGPPIPYDPTVTPQELRKKAEESMEWLILQHQRVPGSIVHAILERFLDFNKQKCV